MEDSKKLYESKTFWGGIVTLLAAVGGLLGYTITQEEQSQLVDLIVIGATAIGGIATIWGRVKANKVIK